MRSLLLVMILMTCALPVEARELVTLVSGQTERTVVREILVRARAELSAVGFQVVRCSHESSSAECSVANAVAQLELSETGGVLTMSAETQGGEARLSQVLNLNDPSISAEVAAIRAVELLRAALLVAIRAGTVDAAQGGTLEAFTGTEPPAEVDETNEEAQSEDLPSVPLESSGGPTTPLWDWTLGVGPSIELSHFAHAPGVGGEFFFDAARPWFFLGLAGDATFFPTSVEQPEGTTDIRTQRFTGRLGLNVPCGKKWACRAGASVGIQRYEFRASPAAGFLGADDHHLGAYLGGEASLLRSLGESVGVFLRARLGGMTVAPELTSQSAVRLGAPSGGMSLGLMLH